MKQIPRLLVACVAISAACIQAIACLDSCDMTHRTHLSVRPHFQSDSPEMVSAFRDDRFHAREDGKRGAVQFAVFGSKTTNEDELARYFMFCGKTELRVASNQIIEGSGVQADILSDHFNIFTQDGEFDSIISFCPKQSVFGFAIHGRKSFWRNDETERGFWASISIPISRVKNTMGLSENVLNNGEGPDEGFDENVVANMVEAFNQSEWNACKIPCGYLTETGVADIELKLGYEWLMREPCHLETYFGLLLPTGKKGDKCFMWAPQVGHGKHFGVMFGSAFGLQIWDDEEKDRHLRFEHAAHTQYLFSEIHCRCLDLKCKPWSRFIEVYESEEQAVLAEGVGNVALATPGVNVFSLPVKVTPGFSHNMNSALVYSAGKFQGELGYNLYCRQSECVKLACPFKDGIAIKGTDGEGLTNPIRDISGNLLREDVALPLEEYSRSVLKENDLDLVSASAPGGISHTVYGSIGWRWDEREYPVFMNVGGSYEVGKGTNALVDRWTMWGKLGFSF